MKSIRPPASRGRPRSFDTEKALERATRVFWKKGYEGASLSDLTRAMGINRPSMYAAFGNKEALFRKALERYVQKSGSLLREALDKPAARDVADHLLRGALCVQGAGNIRGCLLVQGALSCGDSAEPIRQELIQRRSATQAALRQRFERAAREGDLSRDSDPAALAGYVTTILHGLAVQSAGGASREHLLQVVELAMRAWPG